MCNNKKIFAAGNLTFVSAAQPNRGQPPFFGICNPEVLKQKNVS